MRIESPPPLPKPGGTWDDVVPYADSLDCYAYPTRIGREGPEWFDESWEQFKADGALPDNPDALLALLGLSFRYLYWTNCGSADDGYRDVKPLVDEILHRLNSKV